MNGGAWWAAVHGVAKSQTRLSDFTFTFHFHALEREMATHSSFLAWRIPGTAGPGGLPSMGSHRVGHDWRDLAAAAAAVKNPPANAGEIKLMGLIPGPEWSPGGGHGNPCQYPCLETYMDRGTWGLQSIGLQRVWLDWSDLAQHRQWVRVTSLYNICSFSKIHNSFS